MVGRQSGTTIHRSLLVGLTLLAGSLLPMNRVEAQVQSAEAIQRQATGFQGKEDPDKQTRPPALSKELFGERQASSEQHFVIPPDVDFLLHEDEQRREDGDPRNRNGVAVDLGHEPYTSGQWIDDGEGGRFWSIEIIAPGAHSLRLHFDGFELPGNARVVVYPDPDSEAVFGPYQGLGVRGNGEFWSHVIQGNHVIVEYHEPKGPATPGDLAKLPFQIDQVIYGYKSEAAGLRAGNCHIDSSCEPAYGTIRLATGLIFFIDSGVSYSCSGSLLTTIAFDRTPLMATAYHCINNPSAASTVDVAWRYWTSSCNGTVPNLNSLTHTLGATIRDTHSLTDFTLLLLDGSVPGNLYWAGWDASAQPAFEDVVGIHHPQATQQRISFGDIESSCTANRYCVQWSQGVTDQGSSGSPLYNEADAYCGVLSTGLSTCADPAETDKYGRFDTAFQSIGHWFIAGTDDGFETNDTCAQATVLVPGNYPDLVVKIDDEDWYEIRLNPYERADLSFGFIHANGNLDVRATEGCGGRVEYVSASSTDNESIILRNESGSLTSFYVHVYLLSDTRQDYSIDLTITDCGISDDFWEDNDSCSTARFLSASTYENLVAFQLDEDWYRIQVPAYSSTTIDLDFAGNATDLDLELYDTCGGSIVDESRTDTGQESVEILNTTGSSFNAYVRVFVYAFSPRECGSYRMTITNNRCVEDDTYEPDDTCTAGTLIGEGRIDNLQCLPGDPDWFKVIVPAGGTLNFDIFFSHFSDDLDLRLYELGGSTPVDESLTTTNNESVSIVNPLDSSQVYCAQVVLVSGDCNQYDIDVSVTPNSFPVTPAAPTGSPTGWEFSGLLVSVSTTDPDFNSLIYTIDWDDGTQTVVGPRSSGIPVNVTHSYGNQGIYGIRVKARDPYGFETPFSPPHQVDIADVHNRSGNVGLDNGQGPFNVLYVNGQIGSGPARVLNHNASSSLNVFLDASPFGPENPIYAIWGWNFVPGANSLRTLPMSLGSMGANPLSNSCATACPIYSGATLPPSQCAKVLCSTPEATNAIPPATIMGISGGVLIPGETIFFQGVIKDASDTSGRGFSITNAIEVKLQ